MSQDADLLKSLRQASIDYTALQLRFLHEYKGMLADMLGPEPEPLVEAKDAPEHKHPKRTTLSDVLYESARYSMATYAHWLQLGNKQLDFLVDALGSAGRRDKGHGLYGPYEKTVNVKEPVKPPARAQAEFTVTNPYPFEAMTSFETVFLCDGDEKSPLDATISRLDGKNGKDYQLPPSAHGSFKISFPTPRALGGGRHKAQTMVSVDGRQGSCLVISFTVPGAAKQAAKKVPAKKRPAAKRKKPAAKRKKPAAKKRKPAAKKKMKAPSKKPTKKRAKKA